MWITKRELNRRIAMALEQEMERRDRERWQNNRIDELERRIADEHKYLWGHIKAIRKKLDMDALE